jgi:DMSO/TMAO reductase YedYZ molybdopterin-dependent catalytic subunit
MTTDNASTPPRISRRGFLIAITGSAIAAAAGCRPERAAVPTPYASGSGPASAGGGQPTAGVSGAVASSGPDATWGKVTFDKMILTPVDQLYVTQYDYGNTPEVDIRTWKLKVDGLVENPLSFDFNAIKAMPVYEDVRVLECISNPVGGDLIGNLQMKGIRFKEILDRVKVKPAATHLKFEAADGYSTSVELKWVLHPDTMLAYEMNGAPLNSVHGYPLRIMTPGLYGQKMPRWLTRLEFINYDFRGYWESRGWSNIASVQTNSAIRRPDNNATAKAGATVALQGIAYAGDRKVVKVEVQIDDGPWMPATLVPGPTRLSWTQWYVNWTLPAPGSYRIAARATDDTGFVQNSEASGIFGDAAPDGTSAIHRISLQGA